jgi:fatty acid-binding protein DegV
VLEFTLNRPAVGEDDSYQRILSAGAFVSSGFPIGKSKMLFTQAAASRASRVCAIAVSAERSGTWESTSLWALADSRVR